MVHLYFVKNSLVIIYLENNFAMLYFFFHFSCSFALLLWWLSIVVVNFIGKLICSQKSMNLNALDCFIYSNEHKYEKKTPFLWILWCVVWFGVIKCVVFIRYTWRHLAVDVRWRWTVTALPATDFYISWRIFLKS